MRSNIYGASACSVHMKLNCIYGYLIIQRNHAAHAFLPDVGHEFVRSRSLVLKILLTVLKPN